MRCQDVERLLDDRIDGLISEKDECDLEAHLAACADCRAREESLVAVGAKVRSAVDALALRPGFTREVMNGVRRDDRQSRRRGIAFVGVGVLTAAAAALLLVAFLRPAAAVRVVGSEGGLLRLDTDTESWQALDAGRRLDPGTWVLTFPDRRARVDLAGATVWLSGDVLAALAPDRIDLLHGRILVEATDRACRVITPFGGLESVGATVAVTIRYGSEPVFRVKPGGGPTRVRSLLALASIPDSDTGPGLALPGGHLEVSAVTGEVEWWVGDRRGRLRPGETVRLGPGEPAEPSRAEDPSDGITRPLAPVSEEDRELARSLDPQSVLIGDLSSPSPLRRRAAADRLGRLCGGARAVAAVADRLAVERDALVCRALLEALRRLDGHERVEAARPRLRDGRPEVREAALRCWLDLRGVEGIREVGRFIDDPEPSLRCLALRGLLALADPAARPFAKKALEDPEPAVQTAARHVLEALEE